LIEEIVQKSNSPVVTFSSKWDVEYHQVIDEALRHMEDYYSKVRNYSKDLRCYLRDNGISTRDIELCRIPRQRSSALFYMISKYKGAVKGGHKINDKPPVIGRLTLKRIIKSAEASMVTYHLTFEVRDFSGDGFSADRQLSEKEAEAFCKYAKKALGFNVRLTTKAFY